MKIGDLIKYKYDAAEIVDESMDEEKWWIRYRGDYFLRHKEICESYYG